MNSQARKHLKDIDFTTLKLDPDMTAGDIRRKVLQFEWIFSGMPHKDGHFIEPGIRKDCGTRAIDEARIKRCTVYHNRRHQRDLRKYFERMRDEQRKTNLDPAA
jgi:hypothetical protein